MLLISKDKWHESKEIYKNYLLSAAITITFN
jgi:hypothetical protein